MKGMCSRGGQGLETWLLPFMSNMLNYFFVHAICKITLYRISPMCISDTSHNTVVGGVLVPAHSSPPPILLP